MVRFSSFCFFLSFKTLGFFYGGFLPMPVVGNREVACQWIYLVAGFAILAIGDLGLLLRADPPLTQAEYLSDPAPMIDAYRHVEAASVSDAEEQLQHQKHYMSQRMQSIFPTKFADAALTVRFKKEENSEPAALPGTLTSIDNGARLDLRYEDRDAEDIAGMGGLMGTGMFARGFVEVVIDGGVRDLPQLKRNMFPVYATGGGAFNNRFAL
jgi:hypothetical protein